MPKVDGTQLVERLQAWLIKLQNGEKVGPRDLRALLTPQQISELELTWTAQQALRAKASKLNPPAAKKTKRQLQIEAVNKAISQADAGEVDAWERKLRGAEVRQAKVYLGALTKELKAGKTEAQAASKANNELARAGLRRLAPPTMGRPNDANAKRYDDMHQMEQEILRKIAAQEDDLPADSS